MAARYWRGGSGNWNDTGHWSTSSGGAGGASVPGVSDDVIVDQNSGSPTINTNGQFIVVLSMTLGNSAYTSPQDTKDITINMQDDSLGIGSGGLTIYGNVQFTVTDYDDCALLLASGTVNFACYTDATLPYWSASGATQVTLTGTHYYIPRIRIFGTKIVLGTNIQRFWFGLMDIPAGGGGQFDANNQTITCTSQIVDTTFAIAASTSSITTFGFILGTGTPQPVVNLGGYFTVGTITDQFGTSWGKASNYTFEFGDMSTPSITIGNMVVDYGQATITGNNFFTQFGIGNHGVKVVFTGTNVFDRFVDGEGEVIFPTGKTQDIKSFSNDTTKKRTSYYHSSSEGVSATVRLWGTYIAYKSRWRDITVQHLTKTSLDRYDISNNATNTSISSPQTGSAQIFTAGVSGQLDTALFYLDYLTTAPTGTLVARLYSISGTPGSNAVPNTLLATSDSIDASTLTNGTKQAVNFTFSGGARVNVTQGTSYAIAIVRVSPGGGAVRLAVDNTSPTHAGNQANLVSGSWSASSSVDVIFDVWAMVTDTSPALNVLGGTNEGNTSGITFAAKFQKFYRYDVYSPPTSAFSASFIGTIPSTEIISEFGYSTEINNVAGELTIRRAVNPETVLYSGDTYVGYRNRVVVTCFSEWNPSGRTVYTGFIAGWKPNLTGTDKYVDITVLSYASELSQFLVINDPTPDVSYSQSGSSLSYGSRTKIAISFTTGSGVTNLAALDLSAIQVTGGASVRLKVYKDNGSNTPDNTSALKTWDIYFGDNGGYSQFWSYVNVPSGLTVTGSSKYWVVLEITSPTTGADFGNTYVYNTNTYGGGNFAYWNGSSWVNTSTNGVGVFATYGSNLATTRSYNTTVYLALQNILENYALQGGLLNPTAQTGQDAFGFPDNPEAAFVYTFQNNTVQDALNQLVKQAGADWYWYDDVANQAIGFRRKSNSIYQASDYISFQMERDLIAFNMEFTLEPVVNDLLIIGGDTGGGVNLFREYISLASVAQFGRRQKVLNDSNLTDTSAADAIGQAFIVANGYNPTTRAPITVGDNYPLETLHPGMMFYIYNSNVPNTYQIARIDFSPAQAQIAAATVPTQVTNQTQENTNQIVQLRSVGNPTAPTVVQM